MRHAFFIALAASAVSLAADDGTPPAKSRIDVRTDASVTASGGSTVDTGISLDGVKMDRTAITVDTKGDVSAKNGSTVRIGADLKNADLALGSTVTVKNDATVDADKCSRVISGAEVKDAKGRVKVEKSLTGTLKAEGSKTKSEPKDNDNDFKVEIPKF